MKIFLGLATAEPEQKEKVIIREYPGFQLRIRELVIGKNGGYNSRASGTPPSARVTKYTPEKEALMNDFNRALVEYQQLERSLLGRIFDK